MSLAQGNNTPTRPRIEPGSPDPESDALTIRPVRSPSLNMVEYKLGNFVSLRSGKINFFNTLVVPVNKITSAKYENTFMLVIFA